MKIFYLISLISLFAFPVYAEDEPVVTELEITEDSDNAEATAAEENAIEPEEAIWTVPAYVGKDVKVEPTEATEENAAKEKDSGAAPAEAVAKEEAEAAPAEAVTEETTEDATEKETAEEPAEEVVGESAEEETAEEPAEDLLSATDPAKKSEEIIKTEDLPEDFANNLLTCTPSETSRVYEGTTEKIVIVGMDDDKCRISLVTFTLNVPFEKLPEIATYEDIENLRNDENIATFEYAKNYRYANLMSELNQCGEYEVIHHNGRSSVEYPFVKMTVVTDMASQHKDGNCKITFVNEVVRDGDFTDYSVVCEVPDEKITEMLQQYRELIDLYGAKKIVNEDGSVSSRNSVSNKDTSKADSKLMYTLQMNGYCHLVTEDKQ